MISFFAVHRSGLARVQQLALSPRATALPLAGSSHADTAMSRADAGRNAAPATRGVLLHASFLLRALAALMIVLASFICAAQVTRFTVGVVTRGPTDRDTFSAAMVERELANLIAKDIAIVMPADKRLAGRLDVVARLRSLDRALPDSGIDVSVIAFILSTRFNTSNTSINRGI